MTKMLHDDDDNRKRLGLKYYDNSQFLVEKFTMPSMNAPHKQGIPKSNENYAHMILSPTYHNQGAY